MVKVIVLVPPTDEQLVDMMNRAVEDAKQESRRGKAVRSRRICECSHVLGVENAFLFGFSIRGGLL